MLDQWHAQLTQLSGNLTTNAAMPPEIAAKLLDEDESLKDALYFEPMTFPKLEGSVGDVAGLDVIAGLQSQTKQGCLTLFRAARFPTCKRMYEVVTATGYAVSNYEQERILALYRDPAYIAKREAAKADPHFWTQPQERVVEGLPLFCLANDALQIHYAYRGDTDKVLLLAVHIPHALLASRRVTLTANTAIDLDYTDDERDIGIHDFWQDNGAYEIDFESLRSRGVDLHEMYTNDLPLDMTEAAALGITYDTFLVDLYRLPVPPQQLPLHRDTAALKAHKRFLHGLFGDQNIFGRRVTRHLPTGCARVTAV